MNPPASGRPPRLPPVETVGGGCSRWGSALLLRCGGWSRRVVGRKAVHLQAFNQRPARPETRRSPERSHFMQWGEQRAVHDVSADVAEGLRCGAFRYRSHRTEHASRGDESRQRAATVTCVPSPLSPQGSGSRRLAGDGNEGSGQDFLVERSAGAVDPSASRRFASALGSYCPL